MYIHTYIYIHVCIYIYTFINIRDHLCTYTPVAPYVYTHIRRICICMYMYVYIYIYIEQQAIAQQQCINIQGSLFGLCFCKLLWTERRPEEAGGRA